MGNHEPDTVGSQHFADSYFDDSTVSKGFIFAYFAKFNALCVDTHLQARGDKAVRERQLSQIKDFLQEVKRGRVKGVASDAKVIVLGDFNCDLMAEASEVDVAHALGSEFSKLNSTASTYRFEEQCLDHIFVDNRVT